VIVETFPDDPAEEPQNQVYTYIRDELGTVIAIIEEVPGADPDTAPEPVVRYLYDPYGVPAAYIDPTEVPDPGTAEYDSVAAAGKTVGGRFPGGQNLLFQGLWTDPVTGISFARARWYESRNASWLSEDPKRDADSPNFYSFTACRPNYSRDPLGKEILVDEDNELELAALREAIDDPELAKKLTINKVIESESNLYLLDPLSIIPRFIRMPVKNYRYYVSNNGEDWSESENPNARLIHAAIKTDTAINLSVRDAKWWELERRSSGGGSSDAERFTSHNVIDIEINPNLVSEFRALGYYEDEYDPFTMPEPPNLGKIDVPLGIAVTHELGHAFAHFGKGEQGYKMGKSKTVTYEAEVWEKRARQWYYKTRDLRVILRKAHDSAKGYEPLKSLDEEEEELTESTNISR
jgi:RHS repeat-associated protein